MDFFQAQDRARTNSKLLVLLFFLAVAAIILVLYFVVLVAVPMIDATGLARPENWWEPALFAGVSAGTLLLIGSGSLYQVVKLSRGGGPVLAASLGGRPVARSTGDHLERRLLNVVDEMAIASGMPVPRVFVLRDERAINAFAAGTGSNDAVVAVTRGALEQLDRDQLQGVVAHEFSHIFNGDMGLNLRLMGLLHGILLIALLGRALLHGSGRSRSRNSGGGMVLGLALLAVGYLGVFFGRLIKAAVSRQREFLADAAAVQYTRNPAGIAGALKKLAGAAGSRIDHPAAEEASHLFFGSGVRFWTALLATHPPLEERIRRLDPAFNPALDKAMASGEGGASVAMGFAAGAGPDPRRVRAGMGRPGGADLGWAGRLLEGLPEPLWTALREPEGARALLFGLLLVRAAEPGATLRRVLPDLETAQGERVLGLLPVLERMGRETWLPLVELALPVVQSLPAERLARLPGEVEALVRADGRLSLFEFTLGSLLGHALELRAPGPARRRPGMAAIRADTTLLLSLLVQVGHRDPARAAAAFGRAAALAPLDGPWELRDRDALSVDDLEPALQRLAATNFRFKGGLIEACVAAIGYDGRVGVAEAELLRAVGARLDCPVPPLLPGAFPESGEGA